jgi:hypothetical protein
MATFSLGTSGVTPGAPGVYINEQAGRAANADLADFSTVYMLVETDENVPVTRFPFNSPTAITSLNDYKELIRVGTSTVPEERIPLLSYNCVNEFFQNAQVGDLRVVRVGTPNQIVEIELLPSATKINNSGLPSSLQAGDKVYMQVEINGLKVVAGDGETGYTSNGEWLGVPVTIPVSYVAGDEANNRKISNAMRLALAEAIESNPAVRSSVYVRESGMLNDRDPASNSENGFVTISSTTFDGNVSVVTQVLPQGSNYVFMQNAYGVENIVGKSVDLVRVPQDYTQCISTAFDGQQDQGYLITPTAYAQFDAEGRALVGAAAAAHCASNNFKWMALADPGPFLVTDINEYSEFVPHKAAADLVTGLKYLVDNAIYEWTGSDVSYNKLTFQELVFGQSAEIAVNESANLVATSTQVGLLDAAKYTVTTSASSGYGVFPLSSTQYWPVTVRIQKVTLTGSGATNDFVNASISNGAGGATLTGQNLLNTEVYVIAPPSDTAEYGDYPLNNVLLATSAAEASNIYNAVVLLGGSSNVTSSNLPSGAVFIPTPSGDTATVDYGEPKWDLPVTINGQTSDLIENTSSASAGVNTMHLPGTLQNPTESYILNWVSRTLLNPSAAITSYVGTVVPAGTAVFSCLNHNLVNGQKIYFTKPITVTNSGVTTNLVNQTTKLVSYPYWVKVVSSGVFAIANSLDNYTTGNFVAMPTGSLSVTPSIFYTEVLGRSLTEISPIQLLTLPMIRGRKYAFDTSNIWNEALSSATAPSGAVTGDPTSSIFLNNSSVILGEAQITPYGEDISSSTQCGWLPELNLVNPDPTPTASVSNAYCVPTVDQFFASEAYLVPAIDSILLGTFNGTTAGAIGPATTLSYVGSATAGLAAGVYNNVAVSGGTGTGLTATLTVDGTGAVTAATVNNGGQGYGIAAGLTLPAQFGANTIGVTAINTNYGSVAAISGNYGPRLASLNIVATATGAQLNSQLPALAGCYFNVTAAGTAPNGDAVVVGDRIAVTYDGSTYSWIVIPAATSGGDLTIAAQPAYQSQVELVFTPEETPPTFLWRFDAITSTEIIDDALRGVNFNGVPQAVFIESGVDNVNRLLTDSQRYSDPFGFIAYYGPYIENGAGQFIPPSPYVTGVAVRRYRSEGYQFPPAGVKYQLADAVGAQIAINSAQQNLLNPKGCNAVRTLPGYPQTAVFIWGGRTRVNENDAQQRLYQFVNTRVILNVVYGSLRTAFDSQIFNVIDGFGVVFNQIISVGNSVLNQLYVRGALFGARPSDAFQVICDGRINPPESIENGIVNAKVFVTPVPTLERIQIDLIRVAIGKMQQELDSQGLGSSNAAGGGSLFSNSSQF